MNLPLVIAQISDCHLFKNPQYCGYQNIRPYESLALVLKSVAKQHVDIVLVSGDVSGDKSSESYQHFTQLIADSGSKAELKVLAGNHDDLGLLHAALPDEMLGLGDTSLNLAGWQIHGLNSKYQQGSTGMISEEELQTLDANLKAQQDCYHMLALHHHPIATHSWMDKHGLVNASALLELIAEHTHLKVVVYGHIHQASSHQLGHCHILSVPSTCWQFSPSPQFAIDNQAPGYRLISLGSDGQVDTKVIRTAINGS